ncbi:MAG TPA: hypothetical protein VMU84_11925 [Thermoanaerobaculia bacterium]|nr:hypothetical protein [Thermoanaerobaculia bacterium]
MKRTVLVVMILLVAATAVWAADEERSLNQSVIANPLRGAWRLTQTPGEGGPPPFEMLMVFTRDGGVVETDAGPPDPLNFSPGIGEWARMEDGRFVARYTQLQFDSAQNHTGMFDAKIVVTIDAAKNTMSGTVHVRFFDTNDGTVFFEADGTVAGYRLPL